MANPTQQYSYKQVCGVGVPGVVLDRSWNTFFRIDKVGVTNRSRFFRFGEVGDRISYSIWRLRFILNYFAF